MEMTGLGKSGIQVSRVILGCWAMGGDYFGSADDQKSVSAIKKALEIGVQTFDTAELYGKGRAEQVLGEALQGADRESYVLISKAWTDHYERDAMRTACEDSLRRLKSDYLDVYFLHYPPKGISMEEAVDNIMRLKGAGLIRAVGVSNFSLEQLKEAQRFGEIDVIQPCYSLLWRYIDRDVLPYCREQGIGVIPYSTLAQGLLTGKLTRDTVFSDGRQRAALFQPGVYEKALQVTEAMKPIAERYGKTLSQTALNWLICTPGITAPIVGGSSERHVQDNAGAAGWVLSPEDYAAIDEASRAFTDQMPEYELFFNTNIKQ